MCGPAQYSMKQKLFCGLLALALGPMAWSQTPDLYENWGLVQAPPEITPTIDASNFVNHAEFYINFTNYVLGLPVTTPPFETSSTLNYTNDYGAVMSCNSGFRMENYSLQTLQRQRASSLFNRGDIECGTLSTSNVFVIGGGLFFYYGTGTGVKCQVNATNIVNPGTINMGYNGLLTLSGENIDITDGTLMMENTGFNGRNGSIFYNGGYFDGYWGKDFITTNYDFTINPIQFESTPPYSQYFLVTNRTYQTLYTRMGGPTFAPYLLDVSDSSGSNRTVRAIFLSNTNPAITAKVFFAAFDQFALGPDVIELSSVITNTQGVSTNYLYIEDTFLMYTNHRVLFNGYAGVGYNRPTYMPENYYIYQGGPFSYGVAATPTAIPSGTFTPGTVTNEWTAYQAMFQPASVVLGDVAGQTVNNQPGRIELVADKYLALTNAVVSSVNYVLLKATNQFGGSQGAQIEAPYADLYLRSTNGTLSITNVLMPSLPRPTGICNLYSARWTNVVDGANGTVTNRYHVFFVDVQLLPNSSLMVQNLSLTASNTPNDNIYISDVFNVMSNFSITTPRLTLTTNAPGSPAPFGVLNDLNPNILWPTATPKLQYLTNFGLIAAPNLTVFGGSQTSPYTPPTTSTNPYAVFVNAGGVSNYASAIFARDFRNSGSFSASGGGIQLRQAQTAVLANGSFTAPASAGIILVEGGSLLVSNHVLRAGNTLTLNLTNTLDDGTLSTSADDVAGRNIWNAGYGIKLPILPGNASLLATTITNNGPAGVVPNVWAGQDYGAVTSGYNNNAALGRLILVGQTNTSKFLFQGAGGANALYVDYLEMRNYMTNFDANGNLANLQFGPGMKIYYAQLIINGISWAEKLNGKNGGGLNWVSSYAGTFSSTNVVYPGGTTNRLNQALVQSCSLDSNNNGIPNCSDPAPVLVSSLVLVNTSYTNSPRPSVVLSWDSIPYAANSVYYATNVKSPSWLQLTNFVTDSAGGRQRFVDPIGAGGRVYRVQVNAGP